MRFDFGDMIWRLKTEEEWLWTSERLKMKLQKSSIDVVSNVCDRASHKICEQCTRAFAGIAIYGNKFSDLIFFLLCHSRRLWLLLLLLHAHFLWQSLRKQRQGERERKMWYFIICLVVREPKRQLFNFAMAWMGMQTPSRVYNHHIYTQRTQELLVLGCLFPIGCISFLRFFAACNYLREKEFFPRLAVFHHSAAHTHVLCQYKFIWLVGHALLLSFCVLPCTCQCYCVCRVFEWANENAVTQHNTIEMEWNLWEREGVQWMVSQYECFSLSQTMTTTIHLVTEKKTANKIAIMHANTISHHNCWNRDRNHIHSYRTTTTTTTTFTEFV